MNNNEMKYRIETVRSTVKITKAMQVIAASKLHRAQQKCECGYRYYREYREMLRMMGSGISHICVNGPTSDTVALIVVTGDKGLCGDFNHKILDFADDFIAHHKVNTIFAVGLVASEHFKRTGINMNNYYVYLQEPQAFDAIMVTNDLLEMFLDGRFGEVYAAYTRTPTLLRQEPFLRKILPIEKFSDYEPADATPLEPMSEAVLTNFFKQYVTAELYSILADSYMALNLKRMIAMRESTKNGENMIDMLTAEYNHKRQESVTNELINAASSNMRGEE